MRNGYGAREDRDCARLRASSLRRRSQEHHWRLNSPSAVFCIAVYARILTMTTNSKVQGEAQVGMA